MKPLRRSTARHAWPLLVVLLLVGGCASRRGLQLEPLRHVEPKTAVVLIPGITGTQLRHRDSGRVVWGNARSLFFPRDGGHSAVRPLAAGVEDPIEAFAPLTRIRLFGLIAIDIYESLLRRLEAHGYRRGDLRSPRAAANLFVFAYDWRASHVEAAAELASQLEGLRRARRTPRLSVHLICHSNGAAIARYLVKYGDAGIDEAEAGRGRPPSALRVETLILVGSANAGALATLEELNRGRIHVPLVGRRILPETLFTFPALFEALPADSRGLFFDERGQMLDVEVYDPETWRTYGWSIYGPAAHRRLGRQGQERRFADEPARDAYLGRALDRARRLHDLLRRDAVGFPATVRYYSVQNGYRPTSARAMLARRGDVWRTRFDGAARIRRDARLSALALAPGDGHATIDSQGWLSSQELAALAAPVTWVPARHRTLVRHRATHARILEILLESTGGAAGAAQAPFSTGSARGGEP